MAGAPPGPRLPRKDTSLRRSREALELTAYMIGVMLCNERNRVKLTQEDLAAELGVQQVQISEMENGRPPRITNAKIDALFERLALGKAKGHVAFLKWWRAHGDSLK